MPEDMKTIHCFIAGRVQGVCFRMATREQASHLGVTGWVRNLPDGRVEVLASGTESQVNRLKDWLRKGPELARVLDLEASEVPHEAMSGFTIR